LSSCGDDDADGVASDDTTAAEPSGSEGGTTATTGEGADEPEAVDACALVPAEEVSSILGTEVVATAPGDVSGGTVCEWAPAGQGFYSVRLTVGRPDDYEILRSNEFDDLDGVGIEAWSRAYVSAGIPSLDIGVRTDAHHVLLFLAETDSLPTGVALAEAVVAALG
jgi:hypothetical protein